MAMGNSHKLFHPNQALDLRGTISEADGLPIRNYQCGPAD